MDSRVRLEVWLEEGMRKSRAGDGLASGIEL